MSNTHHDQPEHLLTVAEVAEWLSVSGSLIYQLIESGKLPVHRIGNGRGSIRFRPDDVELYIDSCRTLSLPPQTVQRCRPRLKHIRVE